MDDLNMSRLICEEDISKELEQFNVKGEDQEILAKLKNICLIYDYTAEKLVSEWLGYCNKKCWSSDLDLTKIELFVDESFRQEKLKIEDESKTETKFPSNQKSQIRLDADILSDYVMITDDEVKEMNKSNDKINSPVDEVTNDQQVKSEPLDHESQVTTTQQSIDQTATQHNELELKQESNNDSIATNGHQSNDADTSMNYILENKLNESVELGNESRIQNRFGSQLSATEWINSDCTKIDVQPLNRNLHITKPYKTAQLKIHEANEILNESIDDMYDLLLSGSDEAGRLGDTLFVGRVILDNTTDPKNKTLLIENPRLFQRKIKLDLTKVQNYSLFPGQIVCFEGEIEVKSNTLIVNKFYDNELFIPPFNQAPIKMNNQSIYLMAASGPISPSMSDDLSPLENLLEQVKLYQPHYLILLGPFFDCRNDYLLFNCEGESFFNKIMNMISSSLDNIITEAIIVPSTFDLNNYNIFPAPPFEHSYPNIKFMPNPSFLDLNGVIISISSVDIVRHIMREEIKNTDKDQDRICEHLLVQKNLYPLYPPNPEVNLEYSKMDFIRLNVKPHLSIVPSMIKNFVKNVHGSIFINPEYISKGVFAKIRIDRPSDNYVGSICEYTKVEIVKKSSK